MTWDPLENVNDDAEAKKKSVINKIFYITMGDFKRAFLKWHLSTQQ